MKKENYTYGEIDTNHLEIGQSAYSLQIHLKETNRGIFVHSTDALHEANLNPVEHLTTALVGSYAVLQTATDYLSVFHMLRRGTHRFWAVEDGELLL